LDFAAAGNEAAKVIEAIVTFQPADHRYSVNASQSPGIVASLYRLHAGDVYRFLRGLGAGEGEAEDLAGETWLRLWASDGTLRLPTVRAYLMTIARNLFFEGRRRQRRQEPLDDYDIGGPHNPERECAARRDWEQVQRGLAQLPEPDRAALVMHALVGMTYAEIAAVLGLSEGTLKVKVHRARLRLAARVQAKEVL
jgi:RNA polymerase sigma-70 factor (ECF subfamily)